MKLTSESFADHARIPRKHTCEGADLSPPLSWSEVPAGTKSLVLIVEDPDAPDPAAPKRVWTHWVLYNLPPDSRGLPEGVRTEQLPDGTLEGLNDWNRTGWGGPCPPIGRHRYFFRLHALDVLLPRLGRPAKSLVIAELEGHVLASAELMGTYQKGD